MISGYPDPTTNAASASAGVADSQPSLATAAPAGYLAVAALDFVPWRELADRHAWLLEQIKAAGTGQDVRLPGIRAAALALVAVLAELDLRARGYKAAADHQYWCACGFACTGLAAFDDHLDPYPPGSPGSDTHHEVTEEFAAQQATRATESR